MKFDGKPQIEVRYKESLFVDLGMTQWWLGAMAGSSLFLATAIVDRRKKTAELSPPGKPAG